MNTSVIVVYVNLGSKTNNQLTLHSVCDTPETADKVIRIWARDNNVELAPMGEKEVSYAYKFAGGVQGNFLAAWCQHFIIITAADIQNGKIT